MFMAVNRDAYDQVGMSMQDSIVSFATRLDDKLRELGHKYDTLGSRSGNVVEFLQKQTHWGLVSQRTVALSSERDTSVKLYELPGQTSNAILHGFRGGTADGVKYFLRAAKLLALHDSAGFGKVYVHQPEVLTSVDGVLNQQSFGFPGPISRMWLRVNSDIGYGRPFIAPPKPPDMKEVARSVLDSMTGISVSVSAGARGDEEFTLQLVEAHDSSALKPHFRRSAFELEDESRVLKQETLDLAFNSPGLEEAYNRRYTHLQAKADKSDEIKGAVFEDSISSLGTAIQRSEVARDLYDRALIDAGLVPVQASKKVEINASLVTPNISNTFKITPELYMTVNHDPRYYAVYQPNPSSEKLGVYWLRIPGGADGRWLKIRESWHPYMAYPTPLRRFLGLFGVDYTRGLPSRKDLLHDLTPSFRQMTADEVISVLKKTPVSNYETALRLLGFHEKDIANAISAFELSSVLSDMAELDDESSMIEYAKCANVDSIRDLLSYVATDLDALTNSMYQGTVSVVLSLLAGYMYDEVNACTTRGYQDGYSIVARLPIITFSSKPGTPNVE
jgi:hypothetical protein